MGRVRQERFLLTPDTDTKEEEPEYTWRVPLSFTSPGHGLEVTSPSACLDPAMANVSSIIDLCEVVNSPEDPVILNVQQTAFYRVNYDASGQQIVKRTSIFWITDKKTEITSSCQTRNCEH